MTQCKGMNCTSNDGHSHSPECRAEHAAAVAGGRFVKLPRGDANVPQTYAGFAAVHVNETGHTPSEQEAFDAGVRAGMARTTPSAPAVDAPVRDEREAFEAACRKLAAMPEHAHEKLFGNDDLDTWWALWKEARAALSARASEAAAGEPVAQGDLIEKQASLIEANRVERVQLHDRINILDARIAELEAIPSASTNGLTDEQRNAVEYAIAMIKSGPGWNSGHVDTLRALLRASDSEQEQN